MDAKYSLYLLGDQFESGCDVQEEQNAVSNYFGLLILLANYN